MLSQSCKRKPVQVLGADGENAQKFVCQVKQASHFSVEKVCVPSIKHLGNTIMRYFRSASTHYCTITASHIMLAYNKVRVTVELAII